MKRSEINAAIRQMAAFAEHEGFKLPPFAHWTPAEWRSKGPECDHIRRAGLGWDVTDFGSKQFAKEGLTLLTIRNGLLNDRSTPPYCEKLMLALPGQRTPMHFHWNKSEDIINRGGGTMVCRIFRATEEDGAFGDEPVTLMMDGVQVTVEAGDEVRVAPGASVTFTPYTYHEFWADEAGQACLLGEVSTVNDDAKDNRFKDELPRFPGVEEDEAPYRLLCTEYPQAVA